MAGKPEVRRRKCGEIFILPGDTLSLICDFCGDDFYILEDLRIHLNDHFPKSLTDIKIEDSIHCDSNPSETPDDAGTQHPPSFEFLSLPERSDSLKIETIFATEDGARPSRICELLSNIKSESLLIGQPDPSNQEIIKSEYNQGFEIAPSQRRATGLSTKRGENRTNINEANLSHRATDTSTSDAQKSCKRNYKCSFCYKMFNSKRDLSWHENMHTGKRPYKCEMCSKTFTRLGSLSEHTKSLHTKDRPHQCSMCPKGFIKKSHLDRHIRENHLPDTDPRRYFPCKLCDNKFKNAGQLRYHKSRIHTKNPATFTCHYCQREFTNRANIVEHMQLHNGTKKFKCRHCNKAFAQAQCKRKHERICASK